MPRAEHKPRLRGEAFPLLACCAGGAALTFLLLLALPLPAMQRPPTPQTPLRQASLNLGPERPWERKPQELRVVRESYEPPAPNLPELAATDHPLPDLPGLHVPAQAAPRPGISMDMSWATDLAAAPAAPASTYALSDVDGAPRVLRRTKPQYPPDARRAGRTGNVLLAFVVETDGSVAEVRVVESDPPGVFDASAVRAVRQWRFTPGKRGGEAVRTRVRLPLRFHLE